MAKQFIFDLPEQVTGDMITGWTINNIQIGDVAVDLNGVSISFTVRDSGNKIVYEGALAAGITLIDSNSIRIEDFKVHSIGTHTYEIEFTFPVGDIKSWYKGTFQSVK